MSNIDGFQAKQLHNYAKVKTKIPRTWFRMLIDHVIIFIIIFIYLLYHYYHMTVNLEQCAVGLTIAISIIVTN